MNYLLGLSFEYSKYLRNANLKIYADDYLVDDLDLDKDVKLKVVKNNMFLNYYGTRVGPQNRSHIFFVPDRFYLFKISGKFLTRHIRVVVKNQNNNYNNGFMSKFSFLKFHQIFLIPQSFIDAEIWTRLAKYRTTNYDRVIQTKLWPSSDPIDNSMENLRMVTKGGDFTIHLPLTKKHNIVHIGKFSQGKIHLNFRPARILWHFNLLNTNDENQ